MIEELLDADKTGMVRKNRMRKYQAACEDLEHLRCLMARGEIGIHKAKRRREHLAHLQEEVIPRRRRQLNLS